MSGNHTLRIFDSINAKPNSLEASLDVFVESRDALERHLDQWLLAMASGAYPRA